jgi:hypothetical protein
MSHIPDTGLVLISLYDFVKSRRTAYDDVPVINYRLFQDFLHRSAASTIAAANRSVK